MALTALDHYSFFYVFNYFGFLAPGLNLTGRQQFLPGDRPLGLNKCSLFTFLAVLDHPTFLPIPLRLQYLSGLLL